MNNKKVIIGNFGVNGGDCGQTIKTNNICNLISGNYPGEVLTFNTLYIANIKKLFLLFWVVLSNNSFVILPGKKALPVLSFLFWALNKKADYIVIGGWLPEYLDNANAVTNKAVSKRFKIFVETKNMKKKLEKRGFLSEVLPNFKSFQRYTTDEILEFRAVCMEKIKFAYVSRVIKEKGVLDAVFSLYNLAQLNPEKVFIFDIYGPIDDDFKFELESCISKYKISNALVSYKGFISPQKVQETLLPYTYFLFPTYYDGEGFPGCVVDSLSAGLPIIGSDWRYNSELIEDKVNGFLHEAKNVDSLTEALQKGTNISSNEYVSLVNNCILQSSAYHEDVIRVKMTELGVINFS